MLMQKLTEMTLPDNEQDFLGIAYQSILSEGAKNIKGSYYTPEWLIRECLNKIDENSTFLDPCCGSGSFLIEASKIIKNPQNIYGYDTDKNACFISKINLIIRYKDIEFNPNIFNEDFILTEKTSTYDVIATNPPWGAQGGEKYRKIYPQISSGESFSYFIYKCAKSINKDGSMCFVLPESILNVKCHQDIRKYILDNFKIEKINFAGRIFTGVLSNVVVLTLKNSKPCGCIDIIDKDKKYTLKQSFYDKNINTVISTHTTIKSKDWIKRE